MAAFDYVAVAVDGRTVTGAVTAADEGAVRAVLARRKLMPLEVTTARGAVSRPEQVALRKATKLGAKTLALTTRQLSTLVSVAPIEEALRTIALQADRPTVRRVLDG